jgi:uncharacterized protein YraI
MSVHQMLKLAIVGFGLFLAADAKAAITHVTHNLNLRSGPDTTYPPVAIVPAGALIDVLDCGSTWCHVHWASHLGYVNGYYLSSHVTVVVAPIAHVHHVVHHVAVPEPIVTHHVVHHHVVKKTCNYLFC